MFFKYFDLLVLKINFKNNKNIILIYFFKTTITAISSSVKNHDSNFGLLVI
jgi:phosphate starvation-inducible membrane PsiE